MSPRRSLAYASLLAWLLLAVVQASRACVAALRTGAVVHLGAVLGAELLLHLTWALLTLAAFAVAARVPPRRARDLPPHLLAAAGLAAGQLGAVWALAAARVLDAHTAAFPVPGSAPRGALAAGAAYDLAVYGAALAVWRAAGAWRARAERALRSSQLEARLARTQLETLRGQVQPHFLFNTLHAISALMATDVSAARKMITDLGDLLRLSLDSSDVQEVPLREELAFLEQYVDIQRARFRDRLAVEYQVDPDARDAPVPRLLLQPLVENALAHGLAPRSAAGRVDVRAWLQDGALRVAVSDDGVGLRPGAAPAEGHGLGNTRERLRHLYGDRQALEMTANPGGGVTVQVTIPLPA